MCASEPTFAEVCGDDARMPGWLLERMQALGYERPTPVQADALGVVLDGQDAIIQAKTGSGKTLTYLLPLLASLRPSRSVQALVLLPTRELASQVALVARRLAGGSPDRLLVMALLDGSGAKRQRKWLVAEPPQVVVGNVEQVDAVLEAGLLRLDSLKLLVVDEVDACLADAATSARLQRMLSSHLALPNVNARSAADARSRQTLFVSATVPQRQHFRKQCVQKRWCREAPTLVHSEPDEKMPSSLRHGYARGERAKRVAALRVLLRRHAAEIDAAIVFVQPSRPLQRIADALRGVVDEGAPLILSEASTLDDRAAALRALRERRRRLILSTPLGARGLDVAHCSHVYLFDVPQAAEDYLHSAGRCGRNGRPGLVTTLGSEKEEFVLQRIANTLGIEFEDARQPEWG